MSNLNLYRVQITMTALVAAESEVAAERFALDEREVIDEEKHRATACADPVRELYAAERGTFAWGTPDAHPWRYTKVEKIVAEITARKGGV